MSIAERAVNLPVTVEITDELYAGGKRLRAGAAYGELSREVLTAAGEMLAAWGFTVDHAELLGYAVIPAGGYYLIVGTPSAVVLFSMFYAGGPVETYKAIGCRRVEVVPISLQAVTYRT